MQCKQTQRVGCAHSRISDRRPPATLAQPKYGGEPKFSLLLNTVQKTIQTCGHFPKWLTNNSEFISSLTDQCVAASLDFLSLPDDEMKRAAHKMTRRLIRQTKVMNTVEDINPKDGKVIHKKKAVMRQVHVSCRDGDDTEKQDKYAVDPLADAACDARGNSIAPNKALNINTVEDAMLEDLHRLMIQNRVIDKLGATDYRFMVQHLDGKGESDSAHGDSLRYRQLVEKVRKLMPEFVTD